MYTTNTIESLNRQFRKYTKTKSVFPTDMSLIKVMFPNAKICIIVNDVRPKK